MGQRRSAQVRVRLTPRSWHGKTSCEHVEVTFTLGPKLPKESGNPISQHQPILKPENSRRLSLTRPLELYKKKNLILPLKPQGAESYPYIALGGFMKELTCSKQ